MKASLSLLAFAASALARNVVKRNDNPPVVTETLTTYTTVTTCPVTATTTDKGT